MLSNVAFEKSDVNRWPVDSLTSLFLGTARVSTWWLRLYTWSSPTAFSHVNNVYLLG